MPSCRRPPAMMSAAPASFCHVHRVFVAHVDEGCPDLNRLRPRADGGEERERRAELACEVVHAKVRAVETQFVGGYRELDRLQKRIRRCAYVRVRLWCPVPEGEKPNSFHARYLRERGDVRLRVLSSSGELVEKEIHGGDPAVP